MDFVPRTVPLNVCNERLFEYRRGWRRLNLTSGEQISYPLIQASGDPVRGTTIKLQGNTLVAYSYFTGDVHFAQLPSKSRGIPFSEWTLKIPSPRRLINLACDPVQDLLLYLEMCNPHDRYVADQPSLKRLNASVGIPGCNSVHVRLGRELRTLAESLRLSIKSHLESSRHRT